MWSANIAKNNRRLHAAATITLHPTVCREGKSIELFAKIFHHVVALELTVDRHVDADLILKRHATAGFLFQKSIVVCIAEDAFFPLGACGTNFRSLRERTDGRGREKW